jgi:hypothetical protein
MKRPTLVLEQLGQHADEGHRGRYGPLSAPREELVKQRRIGLRERLGATAALRQIAAQQPASLVHVGQLGTVLGGPVERRFPHFRVAQRNAEPIAEVQHLVFIQLLLLMRDVLPLARLAQPVALDGAGQNDRRTPAVLGRRLVRRIDLDRVVPPQVHPPQLVVRQVADHVGQLRIRAPEMLANVRPPLHRVLLVLAVHHLAHPACQPAVLVPRQQSIPVTPPQDFDHVPSRAPEHRLQLLNNAPVAADRSVQTLQIAVDHEDQVVQTLPAGQRDRAQRFRFIRLAVTDEYPHLLTVVGTQASIVQIPGVPGLIDAHDRPQPHRDGRELPEIGHQPRVGIRSCTTPLSQILAEMIQLILTQPPFQIRAGIYAG